MCTVVIRVPEGTGEPVRMLAVRDEDPARAWDPLGSWWPDRPGTVGVRDRLAGGAWLAARPADGRVAVIVNRAGEPDLPAERIESRGAIALDAVAGRAPSGPRTRGFHLVEIDGGAAAVTTWDGAELRRRALAPGTHMVAHDEPDDPATARIAAWRDAFADAATEGEPWWDAWAGVLARSAALDPRDDRSIIRDNRPHGYPTMSLLACVASVAEGAADVRYAELARPGAWNTLSFAAPA
ncbi:NRDE family protein [Microbacterium sp. Marseille-Q6965]|uniref:NRDE family protein n=1 Tax=Microbacterium sp. Marseille-Q6965 TaxID=2965072 RepID=UPI0021B7AB1E|nr:NRDE family protein [Microbacterium sp. Marseille-Q6965]